MANIGFRVQYFNCWVHKSSRSNRWSLRKSLDVFIGVYISQIRWWKCAWIFSCLSLCHMIFLIIFNLLLTTFLFPYLTLIFFWSYFKFLCRNARFYCEVVNIYIERIWFRLQKFESRLTKINFKSWNLA